MRYAAACLICLAIASPAAAQDDELFDLICTGERVELEGGAKSDFTRRISVNLVTRLSCYEGCATSYAVSATPDTIYLRMERDRFGPLVEEGVNRVTGRYVVSDTQEKFVVVGSCTKAAYTGPATMRQF